MQESRLKWDCYEWHFSRGGEFRFMIMVSFEDNNLQKNSMFQVTEVYGLFGCFNFICSIENPTDDFMEISLLCFHTKFKMPAYSNFIYPA